MQNSYQYYGGVEYFEQIPVLTEIEQVMYINDSYKGQMDGVCKIHPNASNLAPYVKYSCVNCLAKNLVTMRKRATGINVECRISGNDELATDISGLEIKVEFSKGIVTLIINSNRVTTKNFTFNIRQNQIPVLVVESLKTTYNYNGIAVGTMVGIPVCESVLLGRKCLSFEDHGFDFINRSVPRGYPSWSEVKEIRKKQKNFEGQIWIHRMCRECKEVYKY